MPIAVVEFAKIDPELTKRLGQIAINWALIEEWLGHMLGTLIDATLGGANVLTNEMGAAAAIRAIKNCIAINEPRQPELSAVRELIEEADELRVERNHLRSWRVGFRPGTGNGDSPDDRLATAGDNS